MAFEAITAPNNRTHWIDREKASQWLQRTIDLANPETTPGLTSPVLARDVLTRSGWNRQLEGIKAAWNALHNYYLAINIPARSEPTYKEEFENAYGKQINWPLISAYGPFSSGSLTRRAGDAMASAGVRPLPTSTRFLIRAFITTDGRESRISCPRGTFCVGPDDTRIRTTGASQTFSSCNTIDDWRCTYWGTDLTSFIIPPLVGSMDLAYAIASRLQKSAPDVIARYAIAVAGNPLEIWPLWNSEAYRAGKEIPSPPTRGSREDILTDPVAAILTPSGTPPPIVGPPTPQTPTVTAPTDTSPIVPDFLRDIQFPRRDPGSLFAGTTTTPSTTPVTQPVSMPVMPTMPPVPRPAMPQPTTPAPNTCDYERSGPKTTPVPSTPAAMLAELGLDCAGWNRLADRPGCTRSGRIRTVILEPRNIVMSDAAVTGIAESITRLCNSPRTTTMPPSLPLSPPPPPPPPPPPLPPPPPPPPPPPTDSDHSPHMPRRQAPRLILMPQRVNLGVSCAQWNALDLTQKMQVAETTLIQQYGVVPMDAVPTLISQMNQACASVTSTMPSTTSADTASTATAPITTSTPPAPSRQSSDAWWLLGAAALIAGTVWWSSQSEKRTARHNAD
jgi:hypothetical protein